MEVRKVTCTDCGGALPLSYSAGDGREPCSECGGTRITVAVSGAVTVGVHAEMTYTVLTTNAAGTQRLRLQAELADLEATLAKRNALAECQVSLKRALEALHELDDALQRKEWSRKEWTDDQLGLWRAHIGARNMAHHSSSAPMTLHSNRDSDLRLRWDFARHAIGKLPSDAQRQEYLARLHQQPVLPPLRGLVERVALSIP